MKQLQVSHQYHTSGWDECCAEDLTSVLEHRAAENREGGSAVPWDIPPMAEARALACPACADAVQLSRDPAWLCGWKEVR